MAKAPPAVSPFGDDDDEAAGAAQHGAIQQVGELFDVRLDLRHEDSVGAGGQAGMESEGAALPAHDLDEENALRRLRRVAQAVNGLNGGVDRGIEADTPVGAGSVVVDSRRHQHCGDAVLGGQRAGAAQRAVAADSDQAVDVEGAQHFGAVGPAFRRVELLAAEGAEEDAAALDDVADVVAVQDDELTVDEADVAVLDAQRLQAAMGAGADDGADAGVHAGRVAAARQDGNSLHAFGRSPFGCGDRGRF